MKTRKPSEFRSTSPGRLLVLLAAAASCACGSAHAADPLTPWQYTASSDVAAGTATFTIDFNRAPVFLGGDENHHSDLMQVWIDAAQPIDRAVASQAVYTDGDTSSMKAVTTSSISGAGNLDLVQVLPLVEPRPNPDLHGWGNVVGSTGYTQTGIQFSFTVPLSFIDSQDGQFWYSVDTFTNGVQDFTTGEVVSGQVYEVPEPACAALFALGLCALGLTARRTRVGSAS